MYIPNEISYGGSTLTTGYVDTYCGEWGGTYTEIRRERSLEQTGFQQF